LKEKITDTYASVICLKQPNLGKKLSKVKRDNPPEIESDEEMSINVIGFLKKCRK
jgi:hypothetical protein